MIQCEMREQNDLKNIQKHGKAHRSHLLVATIVMRIRKKRCGLAC